MNDKNQQETVGYKSLEDLPEGITNNLPLRAQEIYQITYNNALALHENELEAKAIAHRVAWSAVKQTYERINDAWRKKTP